MLAIDFHIHSATSFDSVMKVPTIISKCNKERLNVLAITDHNKISDLVLKMSLKNPTIIVGEEISTDKGEIIGLFLKKEVKPGKAENVVDDVKSQEALLYLPHPFKRSRLIDCPEIVNEVDIIEIWNCRSSYEQNYKALLFSLEKGIPFGCGSDAHCAKELGRCKLLVEDLSIKEFEKDNLIDVLKKYKYTIIGTNKNYFIYEATSQILKSFKYKSLKPLKHSLLFPIFEVSLGRSRVSKIKVEVSQGVCRKIDISDLED